VLATLRNLAINVLRLAAATRIASALRRNAARVADRLRPAAERGSRRGSAGEPGHLEELIGPARWVPAPPVAGSFVRNIGDMLDRMTGGLYRSTPHRVRNPAPRDRLSFPLFFDPNFFAPVRPIDLAGRGLPPDDRDERWDRASVHEFRGTYGDYLLGKVGKDFPALRSAVL
jgi:hypothetical protein